MELDAAKRNDDKVCYNCGKKGHFARNCRQKKQGKVPEPTRQANVAQKTNHDSKHWTTCYNDACLAHIQGKEASGWFPKVTGQPRVVAVGKRGSPGKELLRPKERNDTPPGMNRIRSGDDSDEGPEFAWDGDTYSVATEDNSERTRAWLEEKEDRGENPFTPLPESDDEKYGRMMATQQQPAPSGEQMVIALPGITPRQAVAGGRREVVRDQEDPRLHYKDERHNQISWSACVFDECSRHLAKKLKHQFMPRRWKEFPLRAYLEEDLEYWEIFHQDTIKGYAVLRMRLDYPVDCVLGQRATIDCTTVVCKIHRLRKLESWHRQQESQEEARKGQVHLRHSRTQKRMQRVREGASATPTPSLDELLGNEPAPDPEVLEKRAQRIRLATERAKEEADRNPRVSLDLAYKRQYKALAQQMRHHDQVLEATMLALEEQSRTRQPARYTDGAQENFISPRMVNELNIPWAYKGDPYELRTVEGKPVQYDGGIINRETSRISIMVNSKETPITLDITDTAGHDVILGLPWLRKYNPTIDWFTGQLIWTTRSNQERSKKNSASTAPQKQDARESRTHRALLYLKKDTPEGITTIPEEYRQYSKLFQKELETGLPPHSHYDHEIPLKPGTQPKFQKIYGLNELQLSELKKYLEENLRKGYIRPSQSPAGYPILWVPKKNGEWRMCVDYRQLNDITVKNRYPLPLITELRDRLHGANWFTALDLPGAYNLIRIKEGDEWKTAFRTRLGHYEYLVMPFGLTNAPASFQNMINDVLRKYLDDFVIVYLDDILIYSKTLEQHRKHVHQVLQALQDANLLVNPDKSQFHVQEVVYLGHLIKPGQVQMDPAKLEAVKDWPVPTNVKEVQSFLGFANYYRRYLKGYGGMTIPLTNLTKKNTKFEWTPECQAAFDQVKRNMLEEPVTRMADPDRPYELETDASDYALGGQLGQRDDDGKLHPVAYFSKKLHGPELNYQIHDKELMAIIECFKEWRPYLSGTQHPITVFTDHKNLTYFTTSKELNKRQTRWAEFLSEFNFKIVYRKGSENGRADALSRRPDHEQEIPAETQAILQMRTDGSMGGVPRQIALTKLVTPPDTAREQEIYQQYDNDPYVKEKPPKGSLVRYNGRLYLPPTLREKYVREIHEAKAHGHEGITRTKARVRETYDFPGLDGIIRKVRKSCHECNSNKASRHPPYGELQPIPIPEQPWYSVAMDFIVKLPKSKDPTTGTEYDSILVIPERLTKYAYFLPFNESHTAEQLAFTFLRTVVANHGMPHEIVTDRGPTYASKFYTSLMGQLGANKKLSTAYHPQTDGQTERLNQVLEAYLRNYVNYDQDNWVELLPLAQFAYNSAPTETTKVSPFFANYGRNPEAYRQPRDKVNADSAILKAEHLKKLHASLKTELEFVQERVRHYYNRKRMKGPSFSEGDMVYLLRKNITTKRPSDKLDHKKLGPFKIVQRISTSNYRLSLPKTMRIHPIFHVSLLEPAPPGVRLKEPVEVEAEEEEYEVEQILEQRVSDGKYLVKWKGYNATENTWEPKEHLTHCQRKLRQFHQRSRDHPTVAHYPDRKRSSQRKKKDQQPLEPEHPQ
ncbi:uncharacterized protein E0L32_012424 [Thyridium curvatum]|uniref:RNA-directed DNA polymerase n=1 Tax=Thyridium curvatum TaxID=1093900 RepID=A0A507BCL7_9PEZI|nr:uncharacterized protein E0L32_012424 [Thyridium curvatum]TPX16414.1 hypothetical protein E0L32_012424 [Thyridium curvatum]